MTENQIIGISVLVGVVVVGVMVFALTNIGIKEQALLDEKLNAMTECERIQYDIDNARLHAQKRNALLAQQNAYMVGKCI